MSCIFQGTCGKCQHETKEFADFAGVLMPRNHSALEVPLNKYASTDIGELSAVENLCLVELVHPLEDSILQSTGLSYAEAYRMGRMAYVRFVVCRDCGEIYPRRKLTSGSGLSTIPLGLVVGAAIGILAGGRWGVEIGFVTGLVALFLVGMTADALVAWYRLRRFRDRAQVLRQHRNCPKCGSASARSVARSRRVPCAACGERSMKFDLVAIS